MKKTKHIIEVYPDKDGKWRWRKRSRIGGRGVVSGSGESFSQKHNAVRAAKAEAKAMREPAEIRVALA